MPSTFTSSIRRIFPLLLASLAWIPLAAAQPGPPAPMSPEEKEQEYNALFQAGLQVLTDRELEQAERIWKACMELYPDRPTAYYNLACTYSLGERTEDAVKALRLAFTRGFQDLAHLGRDMDLDPIRRTPPYRAALAEFETRVMNGIPEPLIHAPLGDASFPLLVFLHADGGNPGKVHAMLRETLSSEWGTFVPQGPRSRGEQFAWDDRAEYVVLKQLQAFLEATPRVDRERLLVVGEGTSGMRALTYLAHHPETFRAALAAGPGLGLVLGDLTLSSTRAYLVVNSEKPGEVVAGIQARDKFVAAGSPVVLERTPQDNPFTQDRALLLRALSWAQGDQVQLPGAGQPEHF